MAKAMYTYPNLKSRILATDLDNTIVSPTIPHAKLWDVLDLQQTSLIYITGRHKQSALNLIETEQLPQPDILICDVGASIYVGPNYDLDENWGKQFDFSIFETIQKIATKLELEPQPIEAARRLAYFATPTQAQALLQIVKDNNLGVDVVYSSDRDLDILPKNTNKGEALLFVLKQVNYQGDVIVSGDSENDLSLFKLGLPAIAVGNACEAIRNLPEKKHIHFAKGHASTGVQEIWLKLYQPAKTSI